LFMRWMFVFLVLLSKFSFGIEVLFDHGVFMAPENKPYLETYMYFYGSDIGYSNVGDSSYQASVELTYILEQNGKVVNFSKTLVKSPVTHDTLNAISDFIDQQRFFLEPGDYDLVIKLKDMNNPIDTGSSIQQITINPPGDRAFFSDIMLVDYFKPSEKATVYTRQGREVYPRVSTFYPPQATDISYYCELYRTETALGKGVPYLISINLVNAETEKEVDNYGFSKRYTSSEIEVIMHKMDISELRSGSYLLRFEARDRNNEVIAAKSVLLQRLNHNDPPVSTLDSMDLSKTFVSEITPVDSLRNMVFCLRHQSDYAEQSFIDENWKEGKEVELRRFFYGFWQDRNPVDPKAEWMKYHALIKDVEKNYGSSRAHGCATDRGRIYLKYGKPNSMISITSEPQSYPYEIWHYYKTPEKANAKFVFYDPTRVRDDYIILHSNVLGEHQDLQWYHRLRRPVGMPGTNDEVIDPNPDYGNRALEYWNNPR